MAVDDTRERPVDSERLVDSQNAPDFPDRHTYDRLTTQWAQQSRSYVRSLQLFNRFVGRIRKLPGSDRRPTVRRASQPQAPARISQSPTEVSSASATQPPHSSSYFPLTRRQLEIARLIAQGMSNEQIATTLVLTTGTVGNHVGHILRRLGARNRAQVATWVTGLGAERATPAITRKPR